MFSLLRTVAHILSAIALLTFFTARDAHGQDTELAEVRADDPVAERELADRYERILRSRPQMGVAFDKLYEFHMRQGTIRGLCERLESAASKEENGNLFELLGLLQLRLGSIDDALASLTRAEILLPKEPLASLHRSQALKLKRQYSLALTALRDAVDRKPNQTAALEILKEVRQLNDRGVDAEVAIELLSHLAQQFSSSPQVIEELAGCLIELGRPEAARPLYEKLIESTRDPLRRVELRMQLARLKKRLGQTEQSLLELEQLVSQVKPESWLHSSLLDQIEQLMEDLDGSEGLVAYYQRALLKQPDDVATMLRLARVLRSQSRFEGAKEWISKAIKAAPTQPEPLLAMVDLLEDTQQFDRASDFMQQLTQLEPTNADYIVRWGRLAASEPKADFPIAGTLTTDAARQQSNAAAIWRRLLNGHENDPARMIQVADLLRSIALSKEAVELYEQAVEVSGGKLEYGELLGEYLLQMDRREDARRIFMNALTAAGDDRESLIRLSEVLTRFEFRDEALNALETACKNRPDFSDLIQLATLQSDSERFETALETLNRAAVLAQRSSDLAVVWYAQIDLYKRVGGRTEKIVALEKTPRDGEAHSIDSLQHLALLQAADGQQAEAAATAFKGTIVQPDAMRTWLLAALLQRDAGLSLREIESLGELCKLDSTHAPEYLERIATIHFQLNQFDEALAISEKMLALDTATLKHYQTVASFCLQAKKIEQAAGILQRAVQVFPSDRSAWLLLARQLADLKNNSQSITAAWRVLELSHDRAKQREAIELLMKLHRDEPNIEDLVARIKQFGIERERENDADIWTAWVLLDNEGEPAASELIADLVGRNNAKPELLQAGIELAVRNRDYPQAAEIQKRRCRGEPTVDNQLKLGELLWLAGDSQRAASEWRKVMRYRTNDAPVTAFTKELLDRANWNVAAALVDVGVESTLDAWDFLALGIHANIQKQNLERAAELSEKLLTLKLPLAAISKVLNRSNNQAPLLPAAANDRLAWLEQAGPWQAILNVVDVTRAGYRTNQSNPRSSQAAAVRHLALQRGAALRSTPMERFNIQCFAEARSLAVLAKFGKVNQQRSGAVNDWMSYLAKAIESNDIGQLWDCVLVLEPASCRDVSFTSTGAIEYGDNAATTTGRYVEVLDALVALNEAAAVELAISEIVMRRQLQHQMADRLSQAVPAMNSEELARLRDLVKRVDVSGGEATFAGHVTLSVELIRSQRAVEGNQVLASALATVTDISRLATSARQFLSHDSPTRQVTSRMLLRAFELELDSGNASNDLAFAIASFRSSERGTSNSPDFLFEMIQLQARHVDTLSADHIFSDSRSNESRRAFRSYRKPAAPLPDRSALLSASLRAALIDSTPGQLTSFIEDINSGGSLSQSELTVRNFAAAAAQSLLNDPERALAFLKQAKAQQIATEIVNLYEVWLLVANDRLQAARDLLNEFEPPNESILRECEIWKMDVGAKLGNKEEAQRAASVLMGLPLSVHENADVAAVLNKK